MVTASPQAAAWYRRAQRAADPYRTAEALRLAVTADPDFALAAADLAAITGAPGRPPGRRPMNWERHHIEVVSVAAAGHLTRASDLLREHLASIGCDPLAVQITARLRGPMARDDLVTWSASYRVATPPRGLDPIRVKIKIILSRTGWCVHLVVEGD